MSVGSKLVAIVGPTASGKSDLAMELAQKFNGEIICADSRTIYRYMDIGTAKPSEQEMLQVPHHLLSIAEPDQRFSAAKFKELSLAAITDIAVKGRLPIMVGGTGLYIDSVLYDYQFPGGGSERRTVSSERSAQKMAEELLAADPEAAQKIDIKNPRRVARALETVGLPRSKSDRLRPNSLVLGLTLNKKVIQRRISDRTEKMLEEGLLAEVKFVGEKFGWDNEALRAPAYRAFKDVILGQKSVEEGAADFVRRDINLAKRQMTWFKRNQDIVWLEASNPFALSSEAKELVVNFLKA
ncbi:MAG TPA: tRNA (adenosine(37)-N6)-dimethylallyltransferase MiaA [Candidatus Saccharimonadales bacterium]|nr:tRNA (adenosine(37)-N6)-dimethylallyltransferase MiaA [Candidatus Saccharimonadales bacterium]